VIVATALATAKTAPSRDPRSVAAYIGRRTAARREEPQLLKRDRAVLHRIEPRSREREGGDASRSKIGGLQLLVG
jgi:hypothetical protein